MKKYLMVTVVFFSTRTEAQVQDDFSDGNFSASPSWTGTTARFIVNSSFQLQSNGSAAGVSYLSTPYQVSSSDCTIWRTTVRQSFSPSGSNYGRVYLTSDEQNLTQSLHGYFLQFGEPGQDDAVELFRQDGSILTSVCRGRAGAIAAAFTLRVEVTRGKTGRWQIAADYSGGDAFVVEGTGIDSTFRPSGWCGFECVCTSSNATKFYYDDFYAGRFVADFIPPVVTSIGATTAHDVSLIFSEALDASSAVATTNYSAGQNLENPAKASLQNDNLTVVLSFERAFANGFENHLTISGVKDAAGNSITTVTLPFSFASPAVAAFKDIIITEILADPDPPVGLPDNEYLEIYNRSSMNVNLAGWTLSDSGSTGLIPALTLSPGEYWLMTASSAVAEFSSFPNVTGLTGFPSLNNDGDELILKNASGDTIDVVVYDPSWYRDVTKQNGGWSLEVIDPTNPCGDQNNWIASDDPSGGTPGRTNSVNAMLPDVVGPRLVQAYPELADRLFVSFNEALAKTALSRGTFDVSPDVSVVRASFVDATLRTVRLDLTAPLDSGILYSVRVSGVTDCSGNTVVDSSDHVSFALPEPADSLDVIVNEILFNPRPSGADFVEVYNHSKKFIRLTKWKVANFENGILTNVNPISSSDGMLAPGAFLVLTTDSVLIKNNYPAATSFFVARLPPLPDDAGSFALMGEAGRIIDVFVYDAGMHTRLLKNTEGVSLERISPSGPTNDSRNWTSASSQSGFATPGYLNSCTRQDKPISSGTVTVDPVVFSPGSGNAGFARILYQFEGGGYVANLKVVDQQGRLIRMLANNETVGTEGFFRWDGDRDDGTAARPGYYVVWLEVFDLAGTAKTFRKRVVIAR